VTLPLVDLIMQLLDPAPRLDNHDPAFVIVDLIVDLFEPYVMTAYSISKALDRLGRATSIEGHDAPLTQKCDQER
jgi:hypothetical protein